jgi:TusA-related sulfurtransferase
MTVKLDTRGLQFPYPIMKINSQLLELKQGDILEVIGDYTTFIKDLSLCCKRYNKKLISTHGYGNGRIECRVQI